MEFLTSLSIDAKTIGIIFSGLLLLKVTHQLIINPYFSSPLLKAPGPKGSLFSLRYILYGEFPAIMRAEAGILQRQWAKLYGTIVRAVGPFGIERVMFLSPASMQKVLVSDWMEYPRPDYMRNILGIVAGYGLLTVTGDEHRMMRRAMNPAFSIPSLTAQTDMYYRPIYSLVEILKGQIKDGLDVSGNKSKARGKVIYMYDWMSKVTLDIICLTAFGYDSDSLHNPSNELAEAYHDLISLQNGRNLARIILLVSIPGAPQLLRSDWLYRRCEWLTNSKYEYLRCAGILVASMRRIKNVSASILAEKISEASAIVASDSTLEGKKDVMSLLVQSRIRDLGHGSEGYKMSDSMMMEQVLTFLGAGHETTASGLAWTLWLLATHPEVQTRLRAEVTPVLEANPNPDFRTLRSMEYLDNVVMESLRVFPPVPMTMRKAGKGDYIDGVWVPKGTLFYIAIRVINTYKGFWGEDAEQFRPERWTKLPEAPPAPAYHPTHSFQSFIAGPHHCIGKTMAIIEMKAILAIMIANFTFEPAFAGQTAKPTAAVTMKPADNLPLLVRPVDL